MDNHGLPEEYETDAADTPFRETALGEFCLAAMITACAATLFALLGVVIGQTMLFALVGAVIGG